MSHREPPGRAGTPPVDGLVEMEAMDIDDWEKDQHTPQAPDAKLAALVKQSAEAPAPTPVLPRTQTQSRFVARAATATPKPSSPQPSSTPSAPAPDLDAPDMDAPTVLNAGAELLATRGDAAALATTNRHTTSRATPAVGAPIIQPGTRTPVSRVATPAAGTPAKTPAIATPGTSSRVTTFGMPSGTGPAKPEAKVAKSATTATERPGTSSTPTSATPTPVGVPVVGVPVVGRSRTATGKQPARAVPGPGTRPRPPTGELPSVIKPALGTAPTPAAVTANPASPDTDEIKADHWTPLAAPSFAPPTRVPTSPAPAKASAAPPAKVESKSDAKIEPKVFESKTEPKPPSNVEPTPGPQVNAKPKPGPEARMVPKPEPMFEPTIDTPPGPSAGLRGPAEPDLSIDTPPRPSAGLRGPAEPDLSIDTPPRPSAGLRGPAEPDLSIDTPPRPSAGLRGPAEPDLSIDTPPRPSAGLRGPAEPDLSIESAPEPQVATAQRPAPMMQPFATRSSVSPANVSTAPVIQPAAPSLQPDVFSPPPQFDPPPSERDVTTDTHRALPRSRARLAIIGGLTAVAAIVAIVMLTRGEDRAKDVDHATASKPDRSEPVVKPPDPVVSNTVRPPPEPSPPVEPVVTSNAPDPAEPIEAPTRTGAITRTTRRAKIRGTNVPADTSGPGIARSDSSDPGDVAAKARAAYATGNQKLFAGDTASAILAYRQVIAAGSPSGYRGLGLAYAQQGDKANAIGAFKRYIQLSPKAKDVTLIKKRLAALKGK